MTGPRSPHHISAHTLWGTEIVIHVILPAYRPDERWLTIQLRSILNQAGVAVRIWLCPDGPDEASASVGKSIGDERLVVLSFDQQVGVRTNVERGIEAALAVSAPGDLFAFSDQDDFWYPDKLSRGAAALSADPVAISTHDARVVDAEGKLVAGSVNAYERRHRYLDQLGLLIANNVTGMTMLATTEAVKRALPFPDASLLHDWWIALVVSGLGSIARIDAPLADYRQHSGNVVGPKRPGGPPLGDLSQTRPFLGPRYRHRARETFQMRRAIALHLQARDALAPTAAGFFLHRKLGGVIRAWPASQLRLAVRCAIGMMLS